MLGIWLDVPRVIVWPAAPACCTSFFAAARFWFITGEPS